MCTHSACYGSNLINSLHTIIRRQDFANIRPCHAALHKLDDHLDDLVDVADELARRVALPAYGSSVKTRKKGVKRRKKSEGSQHMISGGDGMC